jgi:hypothetical protein
MSLKKWSLVNNEITFRPEEFEEALGARRVRYITITALPDIRYGVLTIGGRDVAAGQSIARENIKHLRLVPYPGRLGTVSFYFKDGDSPDSSAILCAVNILESLNFAPTARPLNISTQRDTAFFGIMRADDPEDDALEFRILQAPRNGLLELRANGAFVYRPKAGFTGSDKFIYRARDENGNWSNIAAVNIKITRPASNVKFTDMDDHWAANAAIKGVAAGFIDIAPDYKFNPGQLITRAEFVYMAVRAAGLERSRQSPPEVLQTSFTDDGEIPARFKSRVTRAYNLGVINGIATETGAYFDPNSVITRAEAAVILNNILQIPSLSPAARGLAFRDSARIPYWAAEHVAALSAHGIINGTPCGSFDPYGFITRAQSAEMLSNMLDYSESVRRSARWWNFFG